MITCALVNIIRLQWQNIVAVMTIPNAFEFVASRVIIALSITKKLRQQWKNKLGAYGMLHTRVIFEDIRMYIWISS